ncbi:DoxX family protein, partial [Mycolicibacterium fortuitum]|uniref:DoxX family protein n=1 Tax=Mycolicibacterium fortuitum TaxID=1766 RepID=UPI0020C1BBCA
MTNTIETGTATADMTDTGLLLLRIATGATMLQAGLIKAFDFGTAVEFMESSGWRLPAFGAFMVTAAETLGGIGLLLGILTPLAACAVIGAMVDAWAVNNRATAPNAARNGTLNGCDQKASAETFTAQASPIAPLTAQAASGVRMPSSR